MRAGCTIRFQQQRNDPSTTRLHSASPSDDAFIATRMTCDEIGISLHVRIGEQVRAPALSLTAFEDRDGSVAQ